MWPSCTVWMCFFKSPAWVNNLLQDSHICNLFDIHGLQKCVSSNVPNEKKIYHKHYTCESFVLHWKALLWKVNSCCIWQTFSQIWHLYDFLGDILLLFLELKFFFTSIFLRLVKFSNIIYWFDTCDVQSVIYRHHLHFVLYQNTKYILRLCKFLENWWYFVNFWWKKYSIFWIIQKKFLAKRWKKGNWHIWPNGDPLFMGLIHWWLHLINISGCVGSQNDFCRKTKKKISIRRRRRKEGGNGWTSGGTTKLLIQGWRDFRGNSNQPSLLDKSSKKRGGR